LGSEPPPVPGGGFSCEAGGVAGCWADADGASAHAAIAPYTHDARRKDRIGMADLLVSVSIQRYNQRPSGTSEEGSMQLRPLGFVGSVLALALAASATLYGQAKEPWVGTWRLNTTKSTYSPGPKPVSSTVTVQASEGGIKQVTEQSLGLGASKSEFTARFDGKDYPIRGNPNAEVVALRRIDDSNYEVLLKMSGKVTITSRVSISGDGKTRTVVQTGANAKGQKVMNTIVYDRK
jgi:hypothetical protein